MPLRVHVHEQDMFLFARKEGGQIDGGDRLPAAALLVHYGYRAHASLPSLSSLVTSRLTVIARTEVSRALTEMERVKATLGHRFSEAIHAIFLRASDREEWRPNACA